jgi:hypothetical protein
LKKPITKKGWGSGTGVGRVQTPVQQKGKASVKGAHEFLVLDNTPTSVVVNTCKKIK